MVKTPEPFEIYEPGVLLHGTKTNLAIGSFLLPGQSSNFQQGRITNFVYVTETLDAATWGAELASGEDRGHIYVVHPTGTLEDDPNVTNKKFLGNPTRSFRTSKPVEITGEILDWISHPDDQVIAMRARIAEMMASGINLIED